MKPKSEILAPAGGMPALIAAVRCGANAVYFGGRHLNARRNAHNFSDDELAAAVQFCHERNVKAYITLNTLTTDFEIDDALMAIEQACRFGADALILQDIGLADLAKRATGGEMPLHASTQMSVQTSAGIALLKEMGFSRAVIPRELSKNEILNLIKNSDIELEMFVHGALCTSVSGQCLMSAVLGSRSGNRGLCAQPCRLPFCSENRQNVLSLKDLSLVEELCELSEAGISSFKIEGRMKRPEYVAAAVTACREGLDFGTSAETLGALKAVFSRSGFTKGYYKGEIGPEMLGTRQREDVEASSSVLPSLSRLFDNEQPLIGVNFSLKCRLGEQASLLVSALGKEAFALSEEKAVPAQSKPMTTEGLKAQLEKCGSTQFFADKIEIEADENIYFSVSEINSLRRKALEALAKEFARGKTKSFKTIAVERLEHSTEKPVLFARFSDSAQVPENASLCSRLILPLHQFNSDAININSETSELCVEIPRGIFGAEEGIFSALCLLRNQGILHSFAGTLDAAALAGRTGMKISGGFGLNVFNSHSLNLLETLGFEDALLSCEMKLNQVHRLGGALKRGLFAYGRIPLMLTRVCPAKAEKSCGKCGKNNFITDRMGIDFPLECTPGSVDILNSRPIYLADRLGELKNVDYLLLYFTNESRSECEKIINEYCNGTASPTLPEFTRGLYYRGVE